NIHFSASGVDGHIEQQCSHVRVRTGLCGRIGVGVDRKDVFVEKREFDVVVPDATADAERTVAILLAGLAAARTALAITRTPRRAYTVCPMTAAPFDDETGLRTRLVGTIGAWEWQAPGKFVAGVIADALDRFVQDVFGTGVTDCTFRDAGRLIARMKDCRV